MKEYIDITYAIIAAKYTVFFLTPALIVYIIMKIRHQIFIKKVAQALKEREILKEIEERDQYITRI